MYTTNHNNLETVQPNSRPSLEPLLDEREAALVLGVSPRTLWGLASRGEVSFIRVGKTAKRYDPRELRAFCERNRVGSAAAPEHKHVLPEEAITDSHQGGHHG